MLSGRQEKTDARLVEEVLNGKTRQFAELVDRYRNLVYGTILARVRDVDDADDLAQDTFVKAFRQLDHLENPHKFASWIRRIAENHALSFLRRHQVRERLRPAPPGPVETPEEQLENQEKQKFLWEAIGRLPLPQREVVLLFYMEEHSIKEIASFLQISKGTARGRLEKGREKLKEDFEKQLRETVRKHRRGKEFTRKVMAALPLMAWQPQPGALWWRPLGWGLHLGVTGLLGLGLLILAGDRLEEAGREDRAGGTGFRVHRVAVEEQLRLVDLLRMDGIGEAGESFSLFGSPGLSERGRKLQEQALRRGWGGRLVWEFDGKAEDRGWRVFARSGTHLEEKGALPVVVEDGVLRVDLRGLDRQRGMPPIQLVSPELGYDARLFDRAEVRVRAVAREPVQVRFGVSWTNPLNRLFPGEEPHRWERRPGGGSDRGWFYREPVERFSVLSPVWQELCVEYLGREGEADWRGELVDLRLNFAPGDGWEEGVRDAPRLEILEIDRIALRGRFGGKWQELPLPEVAQREAAGEWLGPGQFYELGQEGLRQPVQGDLDGDGDADLVVPFHRLEGRSLQEKTGWVTALNDGAGTFAAGPGQVLETSSQGWRITALKGVDVHGDGLLDLVVRQGTDIVLWRNQGDGTFRQSQSWEPGLFVGAGDLSGDGAPDIVVEPYVQPTLENPDPEPAEGLRVYVNDGRGGFSAPVTWLPKEATLRGSFLLDDFDGDGRPELVQWPSQKYPEGYVRIFAASLGRGEELARIRVQRRPEAEQYYLPSTQPVYLGKTGEERGWELAMSRGVFADLGGVRSLGAKIAAAGEETGFRPLLPRSAHLLPSALSMGSFIRPQVQDLDRDGLADLLFVDCNFRLGACLWVLRGQAAEGASLEGTYLLPGMPAGWVAGDWNGDGSVDVAVTVNGHAGNGVYVLLNQRGGFRLAEGGQE